MHSEWKEATSTDSPEAVMLDSLNIFVRGWRRPLLYSLILSAVNTVKSVFHYEIGPGTHISSKDDRVLWTEIRPWAKFVIHQKLHYPGEEKWLTTGWQICHGARGWAPCGHSRKVPLWMLTDPWGDFLWGKWCGKRTIKGKGGRERKLGWEETSPPSIILLKLFEPPEKC